MRVHDDVRPEVEQRQAHQIEMPLSQLHVRFTVFYTVTYWGNSDRYRTKLDRTHTGELILNVPRGSADDVEKVVKRVLDKEWTYVKEVKEAVSEKGLDMHYVLYSYSRPGEWQTRDLRYIPMHAASPLSYDSFDCAPRPAAGGEGGEGGRPLLAVSRIT